MFSRLAAAGRFGRYGELEPALQRMPGAGRFAVPVPLNLIVSFGRKFSQEHLDHSADRLKRLFAFRRNVVRVFLNVGEYAFVFHSEGRIWTVCRYRLLRALDSCLWSSLARSSAALSDAG